MSEPNQDKKDQAIEQPKPTLADYDKFNLEFQALCTKYGVTQTFAVFSDKQVNDEQDPTVCLVGHPYDVMALISPVVGRIREALVKQISC